MNFGSTTKKKKQHTKRDIRKNNENEKYLTTTNYMNFERFIWIFLFVFE